MRPFFAVLLLWSSAADAADLSRLQLGLLSAGGAGENGWAFGAEWRL